MVIIVILFSTEQRTTAQGQVYYLHKQTGVSTWHDPRVPRYVQILGGHFCHIKNLHTPEVRIILKQKLQNVKLFGVLVAN